MANGLYNFLVGRVLTHFTLSAEYKAAASVACCRCVVDPGVNAICTYKPDYLAIPKSASTIRSINKMEEIVTFEKEIVFFLEANLGTRSQSNSVSINIYIPAY